MENKFEYVAYMYTLTTGELYVLTSDDYSTACIQPEIENNFEGEFL